MSAISDPSESQDFSALCDLQQTITTDDTGRWLKDYACRLLHRWPLSAMALLLAGAIAAAIIPERQIANIYMWLIVQPPGFFLVPPAGDSGHRWRRDAKQDWLRRGKRSLQQGARRWSMSNSAIPA